MSNFARASPVDDMSQDLAASRYPVKVLQFGTGRFIRAFADAFVDEANRRGDFGGEIVMIASTGSGRVEQFNRQNGHFTLWTRGLVENQPTETLETIESIQGALSARTQWAEVLKLACVPELMAVFSNTTEIGLTLQDEDNPDAPRSYPARLAALLHHRAGHFDFVRDKGLTVLPCELVENNGRKLQTLVHEQSRRWSLNERFMSWLNECVQFCNTLVDRIVPGAPSDQELEGAYQNIGWRDELLTVAEPYRLWAIESDADLAGRLAFARHSDVMIAPDITPYRIRKVRLLNGGHTLSVPLGLLAGCGTVLDNMQHPLVRPFIENLLRREIGPILDVEPQSVPPYISEVLNRWSNPFMHHRLIDITLESTTKMRHRVVPTLQDFYRQHKGRKVPRRIALGFAAWLRFMRGTRSEEGSVYGNMHDADYLINDSQAARFMDWWPNDDRHLDAFVQSVLSSEELWDCDLTKLPGFAKAVGQALRVLLKEGPLVAIVGT